MKELILYSPRSQPYGLLSNHAHIPVTINSVKWSSVTEFTYVNLFTTEEYRNKMKDACLIDPFNNALKLRNEEDDMLYMKCIEHGIRAWLSQNSKLRRKLMAIPKELEININGGSERETKMLKDLYNQIRYDPYKIFYDQVYGVIPYEELNQVIYGTLVQLSRNPRLTREVAGPNMPNMSYSDLLVFKTPTTKTYKNVIAKLSKLDDIVPLLKKMYHTEIYETILTEFKTHLLDATLTYILRTQYPHIDQADYPDAKQQQLAKESSHISKYEEGLYNLYVKKYLPDDILKSLDFVVNVPIKNEVSEQEDQEDVSFNNTDAVTLGDEFLPSFNSNLTINGVKYKTIITYAYQNLFNRIGSKAKDLNDYDLAQLVQKYTLLKDKYLEHNITYNFKYATDAKINLHSSIKALLMSTGKMNIVWGDTNDQILGGNQNVAGSYLQEIRPKLTIPTLNVNPIQSLVFTSWFISRVEDYANTLKLIFREDTEVISLIYNITPTQTTLDDTTLNVMNHNGLSAEHSLLIYPFIMAEYKQIVDKPEMNILVAVKKLTSSYNDEFPSPETKQLAEKTLHKIWKKISPKLYSDITADTFTSAILSNQSVCELNQYKNWRINNWAVLYNEPLPKHEITPAIAPKTYKQSPLSIKPSLNLFSIPEATPKIKPPTIPKVIRPTTPKGSKQEPVVPSLIKSLVDSVYLFGNGDFGQLGSGPNITESLKPRMINDLKCLDTAAGGFHSLFLTLDNQVYSCGLNDEFALGREVTEEHSDVDISFFPRKVAIPDKIVKIVAGDSFSAALDENGNVYYWGTIRDEDGQLFQKKSPTRLDTRKIIKISAGENHLVMLTEKGSVYTMGKANQGQLGRVAQNKSEKGKIEDVGADEHYARILEFVTPTKIPHKGKVVDIYTGSCSTFIKTSKDNIYAFGLNNYGQLGFTDGELIKYYPEKPPLFNTKTVWNKFCSSINHTLAMTNIGEVYSIGRSEYGMLGVVNPIETNLNLVFEECIDISVGSVTSFVIRADGMCFSWGAQHAPLGLGKIEKDVATPMAINKSLTVKMDNISVGGDHVILKGHGNDSMILYGPGKK